MRLLVLCVLTAAAVAITTAMAPTSGETVGAVQVVYHSDTRGYYLPCG